MFKEEYEGLDMIEIDLGLFITGVGEGISEEEWI